MSSPDITPYVDLTITDKDPQDIFDEAIADLQTTMPEWVPREGNTEVMLLESMATEVAEIVFALNRVPGAVVQAMLQLFSITADEGQQPEVDLRFFVSTDDGYSIPAGTLVRVDLPGGLEPIVFSTEDELVITPGQTEGVITSIGDRFTADGNGVEVDTEGELLDSLMFVDFVKTETVIVNGRDEEADDDYLERGIQRFTRLSDTLVLPSHFTSFALEQAYVSRAFTIDSYNPDIDPGGNGPTGNDGGHVTMALYGDGTVVSDDDKAALLLLIQNMCLAALTVHLIDPTIVTQDVAVTVKADEGYDADSVETNVTDALNAYFGTANWNWDKIIRQNKLISIIGAAEGVSYVTQMTNPNTDIAIGSNAPLVVLGVVSITVEMP